VAVLATAGVGYLVNGGLLGALQAHLGVPLPSDFEPLLVVLLLGMVTDYAVFFMFAQRRRLAAGETPHEAAAAAAARTGPIVLAAGFAVAGVSAALLTSRLEFFRAFGPGLSITAAVATLVVVTLVPALLSVLGPRLLWPGGPRRREEGRAEGRREALAGRLSDRRAAAAVAVVTTAALLAGATGLRGADLGVGLIDALPGSAEPARAADAAAAGFAPGIIAPTVVLVEGRRLDARRPALRRLGRLLGRRGGVAGVLGPGAPSAGAAPGALVAASGSAARYAVVLDGRPFGRDAMSTVGRLAHDLPRLLRRAGLGDAHARVAGETALARQTTAFMDRELIRVGGVAIVVSLVLLVIFLRALVAPLFLAAASVLSVAATLGLSRYLFQGLLGRGPLVYYVPFAAGALMLAFASDYNIFLAGRIWEAARTRPLAEAIASAAPRATRPIGLAGLVLAGSFALLALVPLVPFRQFAFVMAGGILLEAFVVRPLLVPAGLRLIGQAAMWPRSRRGAP
jgi:RND superfamily putative drug exporter